MALKESNKNRPKPAEFECCGQGCNNHENRKPKPKPVKDDTCGYITSLILGGMFIVGIVFIIFNTFVFPAL